MKIELSEKEIGQILSNFVAGCGLYPNNEVVYIELRCDTDGVSAIATIGNNPTKKKEV